MFTVTLQVWLDHETFPPEQIPEHRNSKIFGRIKVHHTIFEREIELPFAPYPGLIIWLGQPNDPHQDEVRVEKTFYDTVTKRFLCEIPATVNTDATFEQVVKGYLARGWHWNSELADDVGKT